MPHPLRNRRLLHNGQPLTVINGYLINDTFTTDRAAGATNDTPAEPGPGRRFTTDTNSKLAFSGGNASFSTGGAAAGNPGILYDVLPRSPGQLAVGLAGYTTNGLEFGWDTNQAGQLATCVRFSGTTLQIRSEGIGATAVGTVAALTTYSMIVVQRASGEYFFIKGGAFTNWTHIYPYDGASSASDTQPGFASIGTTTVAGATDIRVPAEKWLPTPLASDGFSSWGTSDGLGHAEGIAGGLGAGGSGLSWTQHVGTWQAVAGAAKAASLTSSVAIATVDTGEADVIATLRFTRSSGTGSVLVRYVDNTNFVRASHDGTSAYLIKNVAGVQTTMIGTAATYVAGAPIRVICEGTKFRLYYNDAQVGSEATIADAVLQSGTKQGIRATSTSDTFDDFNVYARGSGGEYSVLDSF